MYVGAAVGLHEGPVGRAVGDAVGLGVDGAADAFFVGGAVVVGAAVGLVDGWMLGFAVNGKAVSCAVGKADGGSVGLVVGCAEGATDG